MNDQNTHNKTLFFPLGLLAERVHYYNFKVTLDNQDMLKLQKYNQTDVRNTQIHTYIKNNTAIKI